MKRVTYVSIVVAKVIGEMLFLYGLLGWTYGVFVQLIHPRLLPSGLSHLIPWIRVDTFAVVSFFLSVIGFLIWRITVELTKPQAK
jgi:hypothetical protein